MVASGFCGDGSRASSRRRRSRAQELIAASRIARAQAHVAAAQPYSESITQVVHDLAAGGGTNDSLLLTPRPESARSAYIVIAADRGLSRRVQLVGDPRRRARDPGADRARASTTRSCSSGGRPRATSATGSTASTPRSTASPSVPPTRTRGRWARRRPRLSSTATSTSSRSSTRVSSRVGTQVVEQHR